MVEPQAAESGLQVGVALGDYDFKNHIDVVGWSRGQDTWIVQQKVDDGTSDEGVMETQVVESIGDRAQGAEIRRRHGQSGVA